MSEPRPEKPSLALHWRILIGLGAGLVVGLIASTFGADFLKAIGPSGLARTLIDLVIGFNHFMGQFFLRALRWIAVPVVVSSLIVGASGLRDLRSLGRIARRTVTIYLATTAIAISVGLALANLFRPGRLVTLEAEVLPSLEIRAALDTAQAPDFWQALLALIPTNPFGALAEGAMLQIIVSALAVGLVLATLPEEAAAPIRQLAESLFAVVLKLVDLLMRVAPYAAFALLAEAVAKLGTDGLLALLSYTLTTLAGLGLLIFGLYPLLVRIFGGIGIRRYWRAIAPAPLVAFSTSSSAAALPITMRCLEERLGIPPLVSRFVAPLGSSLNMDGTALYQGVATVFIAQVYNIDLSLQDQATVVLTATLASIGTASVPGVGLVMLIVVLQSVGMSAETIASGLALIFGVERILDMARTACNVAGDCMVATLVARRET